MPIYKTLLILIVLLTARSIHGEEAPANPQDTANAPAGDQRQLVTMPEQARELMRQDMLDHLAALNEIIGYLASNELDAVADIAETRMGRSSMGKHRASGMGPGRFMPLEMRNLGWSMHDAASELAKTAKQGDLSNSYAALQKVTAACIACHYSYRTR